MSRLIDKFTGRDPADVLAAEFYAAMCAQPAHVALADKLTRASSTKRSALLQRADDATRAAALDYLEQPEATRDRDRKMQWLRADLETRLPPIRHYFATHTADFIDTFGVGVDPRLIAQGKPALQPFKLWPDQRRLVDWMFERWQRGEMGVVVKSRDCGVSFISVMILVALCVFRERFSGGIASATEAKLHRLGDPDTILEKAIFFASQLPPELNGGFNKDRDSGSMKLNFPATGSNITGEAGDLAGRSGRKSLYIMDESAFFTHPTAIDGNLSSNTDCVIHVSTVNGVGNPFYEKAHNPAIPRFDLTWRSDPRKNQAWYDKKCAEFDPVIIAQEIDCNFAASVEGVLIPGAHVQAAIDLHKFLEIEPSGVHLGALDVGDTGDRSAFAHRHGFYLDHVESFKSKDLFVTAQRAFTLCDERGLTEFLYDADGMGAGIRGDARVLNEQRMSASPKRAQLRVTEYRGSEAPIEPERIVPRTNRTNADYFANRKAQSWTHLQSLFREAYKARQGLPYDKEGFISINGKIKELSKLIAELSQPTISETATGKMLVDKAPNGTSSPNLADAVCICFAKKSWTWGDLPPGTFEQLFEIL
ncbi:MAG: TerL protein [Steroidobacteraceae bacterium]